MQQRFMFFQKAYSIEAAPDKRRAFIFIPDRLGNPDEKTAKAIQRVKAFAESDDADPVILVLDEVDPSDLLTEEGKPADTRLKLALDSDIRFEPSFRYVKDIDLSLCQVEHVRL